MPPFFMKAGSCVYMFKIRGDSSYSREEIMGGNSSNQEFQDIIRTVLGNLDNLKPFSSPRFTVFPYKKRSEGLAKLICKKCDGNLRAYPFVLTLYLERNVHNRKGKRAEKKSNPEKASPSVSEPQSKRRRRDSPLEDAIIKDLIKDFESESETDSEASVVGRLHVDSPRAVGEFGEDPGHVDEEGTEGFDEPPQKSGASTVQETGTPGEVHSGTAQDMEEEEGDEEGEDADSDHETPVKPGILTRLARNIFPFSLLFRDP